MGEMGESWETYKKIAVQYPSFFKHNEKQTKFQIASNIRTKYLKITKNEIALKHYTKMSKNPEIINKFLKNDPKEILNK